MATMNLPSFRNSAMDGYCMRKVDLDNGQRKLKIQGEIQGGGSDKMEVENGTACRIFTGALLPDNADIVIIQENTDRGIEEVEIKNYSTNDKSNIREVGAQMKVGDVALAKGHKINPASIGFLASFGIKDVAVYGLPRVTVITTGNELKDLDESLLPGEIYESNSFSLLSALIPVALGKEYYHGSWYRMPLRNVHMISLHGSMHSGQK